MLYDEFLASLALSDTQQQQLAQLPALYAHWNAQINVVSRKDIEQLPTHHVLHSLASARVMRFAPDAQVLDLGTGGGFPGIPLAILYPETKFTLVDSIGKKIKVVNEVAAALQLPNVQGIHARAESLKQKFDFVVTRAVTSLKELRQWTNGLFAKKHRHALPNGILAWKGLPTLPAEIAELGRDAYAEIFELKKWLSDPFFETKGIVYLQD